MSRGFQSPDEVHAFVTTVIERLKSAGFDATPLEKVQSTAYTTGSEWLGELGRAVTEVQKQPIADPQTAKDLDRILRHVKGVWPAIRTP
jgi:hypothetical protein